MVTPCKLCWLSICPLTGPEIKWKTLPLHHLGSCVYAWRWLFGQQSSWLYDMNQVCVVCRCQLSRWSISFLNLQLLPHSFSRRFVHSYRKSTSAIIVHCRSTEIAGSDFWVTLSVISKSRCRSADLFFAQYPVSWRRSVSISRYLPSCETFKMYKILVSPKPDVPRLLNVHFNQTTLWFCPCSFRTPWCSLSTCWCWFSTQY